MLQNGKTLSMHNEAIWKGTYTNNGMLLKIHENAYTIGYSALLSPDGTGASGVKFGNGVFYDAKAKNNKVYAGVPTVENAVPVFAGIIAREPALASGYPVNNDEVQAFQNGMLVKEGYIVYKNALVGTSATEESVLFDSTAVTYGTKMFVKASTGVVYFDATGTAGDYYVGTIVEINPDDKSVTVFVSPVITEVKA